MKRVSTIALITLLPACANIGLDGAPPLEEAAHAAPPELVAAVYAPQPASEEQVVVDGRLWVPWGLPAAVDAADLRSVGSAHGMTVYARSWDATPYDALFARRDGEWQRYAPVIGRSGRAPAH